jgi:SiaC family regulatory phosphoprotein
MNDLVIEKTKSSPEVNFNAATGKWKLIGSSYPENASEFYQPIFVWINKYITEVTREILIDFKLDYLNSSSIKFISEMIDKFDKYGKIGVGVEINWHYREEDEDILDLGNEFKEEVTCKFNIIED